MVAIGFMRSSLPQVLPLALVLGLLSTLAISACGEVRSQQCETVCIQEADCAEERENAGTNYPYDKEECIAACVALERDVEGKKFVQHHVKCAKKATSCHQLLLCRGQ